MLGGQEQAWDSMGSGELYYGTIKSYNSEKGWGHIDCEQTRQIYGKDMFVLRSQLSGASVRKGDQVEFRVRQGQQGPEATNVRIVGSTPAASATQGGANTFTTGCAFAAPFAAAPTPPPAACPGYGTPQGQCAPAPAPAPLAATQQQLPLPAQPCWGQQQQQWGCPPVACGQSWAGSCNGSPVSTGPFLGIVRGYVPERGWGHIQSEQSQQIYGRDILLLQNNLVGGPVQDGDMVRFSVRLEQEGPVGVEVQMVSSGAALAAQTSQQWGSQPVQPGYWQGSVPNSQIWGAPPSATAMPSAFPQNGALLPPGGELIPSMGLQNGTGLHAGPYGAPAAQPEWGACCPGYGQQPQYGQQAMVPCPSPPPCQSGYGAGGHLWGSQAALPTSYGTPPPQEKPVAQGEVYFGVVKAFDEEKGWGHISCDVTRQMFGKDMFVLRSSLHGTKIAAGDEVQFTLRQGLRGVEATEVRPLSRGAVVTPATGREFVGVLKMFDNTKGWGFLECDESRQLYGKDIFVHKREFPKGCTPENGDRLRFVVERGRDARPEARRVTLDSPLALTNGGQASEEGDEPREAAAPPAIGPVPCGPELPPASYGALRAQEPNTTERAAPY